MSFLSRANFRLSRNEIFSSTYPNPFFIPIVPSKSFDIFCAPSQYLSTTPAKAKEGRRQREFEGKLNLIKVLSNFTPHPSPLRFLTSSITHLMQDEDLIFFFNFVAVHKINHHGVFDDWNVDEWILIMMEFYAIF